MNAVDGTTHERGLRTAGAAIASLAFAMGIFTLVLIIKDGQFGSDDLASSLVAVCFAPVGGLIAVQRPRHAVGWLLLFVAFTQGVVEASGAYAYEAGHVHPGMWPGGSITDWLNGFMWMPGLGVLATLLLLLFPTGTLPSPRWRIVAVPAAVATAVLSVGAAVTTWNSPHQYNNGGPPPALPGPSSSSG